MRLAYAISLVALVTGCGDNSLMTNQDMAKAGGDSATPRDMATSGNDMAVPIDMTQVGDMAREIPDSDGVNCGMGPCMNGQQCCAVVMGTMITPTCMDSCPDGSVDVMCDGPEDCSGNPCCVGITVMGMMPQFGNVMCTQMPTDCQPMLGLQGGQTRFCHVAQDCTDGAPMTTYNKCCMVTQGGNTTNVCLNDMIAGIITNLGGMATCP